MKDVSIIIVSWKVKDQLRNCLESIIRQKSSNDLDIETIIVDNASNDGTAQMIKNDFQFATLIENLENKGFAKASNQGAKKAQGKYLLFLNPDTELTNDSLAGVISFMEEQPFVGAVGPKLINPDGSFQPSCRRFPTVFSMSMILTKLHRLFPNSLPLRRYFMTAFKHETLREVDQLMGSALCVRKEAFEKLGGFDEKFFIWFEEVDLCKRLKNAGYIIFFAPWARVIHLKGRSFDQRNALWTQWNFAKSCRHYFWKHHNILSATTIALLSFVSLLPALFVAMAMALKIPLKRSTNLNQS